MIDIYDPDLNPPPVDGREALAFAVSMQRCLAMNLGYLDVPTHDEDIPATLTWQELFAVLEVEHELINDFVIRRMLQGERLTAEWTTRPGDED